ncbi:hypothetical protein QLX08_010961 [Tetragonisca angustula]|uniref:Uncharacterized protein n=1 Tax=Tetragonisca angustula TaxID=166442 RepID=A0AAW0ZC00_9HYME
MSTLNAPLVEPELFKTFAFWGSILAIKLLAMAPLTARYRFKNMVFSNIEDTKGLKGAKVNTNDPEVERDLLHGFLITVYQAISTVLYYY